jgi:hypothetical protein
MMDLIISGASFNGPSPFLLTSLLCIIMDELQKTATEFTAFYYAKIDDAEKRAELKDLYVRHANLIPKISSC